MSANLNPDPNSIQPKRSRQRQRQRTYVRVICGFPGVGKTALSHCVPVKAQVVDLRPNDFDQNMFPANYVAAIAELAAQRHVVLCSAQPVVCRELVDASIPFVLVYPTRDQKTTYVSSYFIKGDDANIAFAELLNREWDRMIDQCEQQPRTNVCAHVVLQPGQWLSMDLNELVDTINRDPANVNHWLL
jgi:hypothetical protein